MKAPLLIELQVLGSDQDPVDDRLIAPLAELNQNDQPLVLLAERPDRWTPSRNRVDHALQRQTTIEHAIHRGGGALDAVIYLDLGWFSRPQRRRKVLADLAERYGCGTDALVALVGSERMSEAIRAAVGRIERVPNPGLLRDLLRKLNENP